MKFKSLVILAVAILSAVSSSCVHREFEYDTAFLDVVFDWRNDPDADPASMTLFMFPKNGGAPIRFDFAGRDGGQIYLAPGVYDAICINSDKRNVIYRNPDKFYSFEVTTPIAPALKFITGTSLPFEELPKASGTSSQKMVEQPPMLWSSSELAFEVTVDLKYLTGGHQRLYMYPKPIVDTYMVHVQKIQNIQSLSVMSGTISDMSDSYFAGLQKRSDTEFIVPFQLTPDFDNSTAEGTFLTFGHCPDSRHTHKLMLYVILSDLTKHSYEFNVSDQAHNPPDENGIYHIYIEFLPLDESEGPGLRPEVGEWNTIYIGLIG